MELSQLRANFKALNFTDIVSEALEKQKAEIIEYQKAQMLHGENVEGKKIGKYKNMDYIRKKANMNPLAGYGNVDLKLTGEFQRNMNIRFFADSFVLFSNDSKAEDLVSKYGPTIFGLNAGFIKDFAEVYLNEELTKQIHKRIYGL